MEDTKHVAAISCRLQSKVENKCNTPKNVPVQTIIENFECMHIEELVKNSDTLMIYNTQTKVSGLHYYMQMCERAKQRSLNAKSSGNRKVPFKS